MLLAWEEQRELGVCFPTEKKNVFVTFPKLYSFKLHSLSTHSTIPFPK